MQSTSTIRTNDGLTKINNESRRSNRQRNRGVFRTSISRVRRLFHYRIVPPRRITRRHTNTMRNNALVKVRRRSRRIIRRRRRRRRNRRGPSFPRFSPTRPRNRRTSRRRTRRRPNIMNSRTNGNRRRRRHRLNNSNRLVSSTLPKRVVRGDLDNRPLSPPNPTRWVSLRVPIQTRYHDN